MSADTTKKGLDAAGAGTPTLDQLKAFLAVVDAGSFTAAARQLNRATSVISYSIGNLEAQLGFPLFERDATRRPILTAAGRNVLSEARTIVSGVNRLRATANGIRQGLEARLSVVFDVMLPASRILDALKGVLGEFPTLPLHVRVEALGAVTQLVLDDVASIGICGPPDVEVPGLERIGMGSVELIPVAAPDHPLALPGSNRVGAARDHVQIVLSDRSERTRGQDYGVVATHTWRVTDLATKHMLLLEGVGWGNMPVPMIRDDLKAGRLVRLDLPDYKGGAYRFFAIHRSNAPPGPAGTYLLERFAQQLPSWQELELDVRPL
jgi:DNA-binding transcriptional LysR family regulator